MPLVRPQVADRDHHVRVVGESQLIACPLAITFAPGEPADVDAVVEKPELLGRNALLGELVEDELRVPDRDVEPAMEDVPLERAQDAVFSRVEVQRQPAHHPIGARVPEQAREHPVSVGVREEEVGDVGLLGLERPPDPADHAGGVGRLTQQAHDRGRARVGEPHAARDHPDALTLELGGERAGSLEADHDDLELVAAQAREVADDVELGAADFEGADDHGDLGPMPGRLSLGHWSRLPFRFRGDSRRPVYPSSPTGGPGPRRPAGSLRPRCRP